MDIFRALQIAERKWENIGISLKNCGDIGEFNPKDYLPADSGPIHKDLPLFRNLIEMENKFPKHGYFTPEAAFVFSTLASKAGERLGLKNGLAQTCGSGYSWVRTGALSLDGNEGHKHIIKQLFFFKLFFPIGGFFNWDFNSHIVQRKFNLIFYKFATWQNNPDSYILDVRDCRELLEPIWHGLLLAMGYPATDWSGACESYIARINDEV